MKEITPVPRQPVTFQLLDSVRAYVDGEPVDVGPRKERRLLVALISAEGHLVAHGKLMDWVWDDAPASGVQGLYEVTSDLRARLATMGLGGALFSKGGWSRLDIDPDSVDVHRFRKLIRRARDVTDDRRRELLVKALELCRGEPLAGLDGQWIDRYRDQLADERRSAEVLLVQLDVRYGRCQERLPDLARLLTETPHNSRIAGLCMYALHKVGQTGKASEIYRAHQALLRDSGIDVPTWLENFQRHMLNNEPDLGPDAAEFLGGRPVDPSASSETNEEEHQDSNKDEQRRRGRDADGRVYHQNGQNIFNDQATFDGRVNNLGNGPTIFVEQWNGDSSQSQP